MNNNNTIELLDSSSSEEEDEEDGNENENDYQVEEEHRERLESELETVPDQNQETLEECNEIIEHHRAILMGSAAAVEEEPTSSTEGVGAVAIARSASGGEGDDVIELLGDTSDDDDNDDNDDENDCQQQQQQNQQQRPNGILSIEETAAAMCSTSTSTTPNTAATATVGTTTVNSDAASTDDNNNNNDDNNDDKADNDNNSNTHPRSLHFLKNHCWECHHWIHHPGSALMGGDCETSTSTDDDTRFKEQEICCYALHLHPVFEVPVCVVCAENIESVERRRIPSSSSNDNSNDNDKNDDEDDDEQQNQQQQNTLVACSGCGKTEDDFDDEKLFLCDYCPRIVCQKCLEQAHGRSKQTQSESITDRILSQSEDEKWRCFCCCHDESIGKGNVPRLLRKLRTATAKLFSTNNKDNKNNTQRHQKQTIEELLHELDIVETKKRQCDEKLDNQIVLRQEIRQDILAEQNYNENDFEEGGLIDQVVQKTYEDWIKHQTRLFDRISILEDLIKSEQGVEALAAYRYIDDKNKNNDDDESSHNHNGIAKKEEEEEEPHWKISADRALAKKAEEERLQMRRKGKKRSSEEKEGKNHRKQNDDLNHARYRLEITEDVEDLGSSCSSNDDDDSGSDKDDDDDDKDAFRNDWRSSFSRAREADIELARDAEDRRRVEENKVRLTVRSRSADKEDWTAGLKEMVNKNNVRTLSSSSSLKPLPSQVRTVSVSTATVSSSTPLIIEVPTDALQRTSSSAFQRRGKGLNNNNINIKNEGVKQITIKASPAPSNNELQPLDSKSFKDSSFVLSENPYISIADHFVRHLKPHQKEGIKFMYNNSFADLGCDRTDVSIEIGGCILAHSMGLGKSLACVSLLHAIMLQPSLVDTNTNRGNIHKVLLVVPVNTLSNWENEFEKWTKGMNKKINITNISSGDKYSRKRQVKSWSNMGGILLSSDALFRNMVKHEEMEKHLSSTDAIVLDERYVQILCFLPFS
jgi:hypothetical protein